MNQFATAYEQVPTHARFMPTTYAPMDGVAPETQAAAPSPAPMPAQTAAAEQPPQPRQPADKWEAIEMFVGRIDAHLQAERELSAVLERRNVLGRRLQDAFKRRDEEQAIESTQAWIKTELQMEDLWTKFEPHVVERKATLKALGVR